MIRVLTSTGVSRLSRIGFMVLSGSKRVGDTLRSIMPMLSVYVPGYRFHTLSICWMALSMMPCPSSRHGQLLSNSPSRMSQ